MAFLRVRAVTRRMPKPDYIHDVFHLTAYHTRSVEWNGAIVFASAVTHAAREPMKYWRGNGLISVRVSNRTWPSRAQSAGTRSRNWSRAGMVPQGSYLSA